MNSEYGRRRGHAGKYGSLYKSRRWQKIRQRQLTLEPLCQGECKEKNVVTVATVCDHIEPHHGDIEKFYSGPFQSLCERCHNSFKQRLEKGGGIMGCDSSGNPIDPNHHWNA